jgi:hypothetical protein
MERRPANFGDWIKIGYVEGSGTTSNINYYEYWDYNVPVGSYAYRYKQFDSNGSFSYSNTLEIDISPPGEFVLYQNYPNPFNPVTRILYKIPEDGNVKLVVYNALGAQVEILVDEYKQQGYYEAVFYSDNVSSGVYVYSLQYAGKILTKKMLLLK